MPRVRIPLKDGKDAIAIQHQGLPQFLVDLSDESINRDESRTPMPWNSTTNAGFCADSIKPWLPIAANYKDINVEKQLADPNSQINFYKKVIHIRKDIPALNEGSLEIADDLSTKKILAYYRISGGEKYLVLLNMTKRKLINPAPNNEILISTCVKIDPQILQPFEGRVLKISK